MTDAAGSPCSLETDPLAGTAYRAVRRIGAGAMGQVFEAEHAALRRRVAVKLLGAALAGDPLFVDRLRLEAQALASLHHPHVVAIHDYATTPSGVPFLVMELLRGRTLHELLRERGALPLPEALHMLDQVLSGLSALHAAGLTHRDLKPANIFLCEERGRTMVKLLDLGIVKVTRPEAAASLAPLRHPTQQGHAIGTPRFMAPEQVLGGDCDARTDVYAAGVLLFFLLAGRDPFHHHRAHNRILAAQVTEPPPLLSTVAKQPVPPGLEAAVHRALSKDPSDRFASVADFAAALSASVTGTERMQAVKATATDKLPGPATRAAQKTAPIDASSFRTAAPPLPFVRGAHTSAPASTPIPPAVEPASAPSSARLPPTFGLPAAPPVPARIEEAPGPQDPVAAASGEGSSSRLSWAGERRILLAIVALI
jgi:serine/threonine-protein kinase